ncbi:MAG TPA: phytanoyl-CoA dioxygenase family protein [Edaphobacter sp.]|nr:phytanoyl-CoA dioxygenase family protein [Edaphobacter sp.]
MIQLGIKIEIERNGYALVDDVLSESEVAYLLIALEQISTGDSVRRREGVFAVRNLLDVVPEVRKLAHSKAVGNLVKPVLCEDFFPVRGILFDKIPDANWKVPWHQDVTIAVQERVEVEGYGPWSVKADVLHVQPPLSVLENILSVRLHLDDCSEENGAVRVIPGSHLHGRISEGDISEIRKTSNEVVCSLSVGGALLMRPLLLHASAPSQKPGHRRVIHLDFSSAPLHAGLRWFSESHSAPDPAASTIK